ncbi:MAG: 50S ribosomal protein L15 [candidate division SR1 bacterium]|nr:50S ribosomal protein L15 [candidate division SR1 bacterium]
MKIHQLIKSKGLRDKARRLGRGNATGSGNYSGRGLKGQKARSGHGHRAFFEGGQTSIVQRLPKARGFTRYFKLVDSYEVVNLGKLNLDKRVADTMEISKASLKQLGYIKNEKGLVKILGDGEYTKHLTFTDIDAFSTSAKTKIDKPGTASKTAGKPYAKIDKTVKAKKPVRKMVVTEVKKPAVKKIEASKAEAKKVEVKKAEAPKVEVKKVEAPKPTTAGKVEVKKTVAKPVAKPTAKAAPAKKAAPVKPVAKKPAPKKAK